MDDGLKRVMEPRVPSAGSRLKAIALLAEHGIPTSVLIAPVIPAINDHEIESILKAVADAGADQARYIFLRLPHELLDIFTAWLDTHFADRKDRVLSLVKQASGGRSYDARFGVRQTGRGAYADMLASRFRTASRKLGLEADSYQHALDCTLFQKPGVQQLGLDF
jgi:DNA repair photolyase